MPELDEELNKYVTWPNEVKVEGSLKVKNDSSTGLGEVYTIDSQTKFDQNYIEQLTEEWNTFVDSSAQYHTKDINGRSATVKATGKLVSVRIIGDRYAKTAKFKTFFESKNFVNNVYEEVKKAVNEAIEINKDDVRLANLQKKPGNEGKKFIAKNKVKLINIDIVIE